MLPSFDSQSRKRLKSILDVTTNIVVILFAVIAIGVLVRNYFAPQSVKNSAAITKGSIFPEIAGVDYKQTPRTLILALNVDCRYCTRSVPFYNSLADARQENAGQVNIIAAFINKDPALVKSYADEKQLSVQAIAGIDFDKLGIHSTPTLVLIDSAGKVLDSWTGELKPDGEREVFTALGLPYKPKAGSTSTAANVKKTVDVFDEQKTTISIRPQSVPQDNPTHLVEVFDVNSRGDVYLIYDKYMYMYDAEGRPKDSRPRPQARIALPADLLLGAALSGSLQDRSQVSADSGSLSPFETCSFQPDVHAWCVRLYAEREIPLRL